MVGLCELQVSEGTLKKTNPEVVSHLKGEGTHLGEEFLQGKGAAATDSQFTFELGNTR